MVVAAYLMLYPLVLLFLYRPAGVKIALPTATLVLCGAALMLESLYRVVAASVTSGWFLTQAALNVLLVMPELIVLLAFTLLDFDDLARVRFVRGGREEDGYDSTPSAATKDVEAYPMEPVRA
jgi:hypothetical protein